tara:strand:- start:568 stop:753 length:186 start_codon:yes stop_codon:yes gene_type:complete
MIFLSNPQVWQLAGTWSDSVTVSPTGMTDLQMMISMHVITVPLVLILGAYFLFETAKKAKV